MARHDAQMERSHYQDEPRITYVGRSGCNASPVTINSAYLARIVDKKVVIQTIADGHVAFTIEAGGRLGPFLLTLSETAPSYVAIGHGTAIDVYDIDTQRSTATLKASDRCITALAWSSKDAQLASGTIDGSIVIWSLSQPSRPVARCKVQLGVIRHIAWSTSSEAVLAVVNDYGLHLWDRIRPAQLVVPFKRTAERLQHLCWSQHHAWTLLGSSHEGNLYVWDLSSVIKQIRTSASRPKSLVPFISLVSQKQSFRDIIYLRWTSEQTAAFLYEAGKKFAVVDLRSPSFGSIDWELGFSHSYEAFDLESDGDKAFVRMLSQKKQRPYALPGNKGGFDILASQEALTAPNRYDKDSLRPLRSQTMSVTPISKLRHTKRRKADDTTARLDRVLARSLDSLPIPQIDVPPSQATHKHLDVSSVVDITESPMPFLSPAIPARRPPSKVANVPPLTELSLPKPESDGYFGSFSSTTIHDSDSDDDAYDLKNSKDSTRLMPGGVNVPLPRSCGAVFSISGALIVFRPPLVRATMPKETLAIEQSDDSHDDIKSTALLFPAFGNLFAAMAQHSASVGAVPSLEHYDGVVEALGLDRASYSSKKSWQPHSLSALPAFRPPVNLPAVEVSVRLAHDALFVDREPALHYRVLTAPGEKGAALCLANAATSIRLGREGHALAWQTLAKVIEDLDSGDDCARSWCDHPLGASWLVRQLYETAEMHGSLSMLACITVVLIGSVAAQHLSTIGEMVGRLAIPVVMEISRNETVQLPILRAIPSLKTDFGDMNLSQQVAGKQRTGSTLSSRAPSLPTTPRLESSSSTPPWSFASLANSGSKSSFSNSMSPEHTRSSFSAAVKSYAQSVSDKFASYGTSPPVRKSGPNLSPNPELSSSLPGAGGSWTKSVSFASTTVTQWSSTSAITTALDEGYDSDRTIEDAAAIFSNRSIGNELGMTWKNKTAFSHERGGVAERSLIPTELLPSCKIWISAHAERLRAWSLDVQAVEFEKIGAVLAGMTSSSEEAVQDSVYDESSLTAFCSICFCAVDGLAQVCPWCKHASHVECLMKVSANAGQSFECSTCSDDQAVMRPSEHW